MRKFLICDELAFHLRFTLSALHPPTPTRKSRILYRRPEKRDTHGEDIMGKRFSKRATAAGLFCAVFLVLASLLAASAKTDDDRDDGPKFGPWSAPVNLGPPVNSVGPDYQPFISKDGLSLYFSLLEGPTQNSPQDIWVSKRDAKSDPWGTPQRLGPSVNSAAIDGNAFVTVDGHWMYFNSNRKMPDANGVVPFGLNDIYVAHRQNKRQDFGPDGWQDAVNVGAGVNTSFGEAGPFVLEDEVTGVTTMYFTSNRIGLGGNDIYASTLQADGTFGPAQLVSEVSSRYNDQHPSISRDGLEMYFMSDRSGSTPNPDSGVSGPPGEPSFDIWVSTRLSTSDAWGTPQNLDAFNQALGGPAINSPFHDGAPSLSFDGRTLYFYSALRQGNQSPFFDIWMTTRTKLKQPD
jgi:hypothetical protein